MSSPRLNTLVHRLQRNVEDYGWPAAAAKVLAYLLRAVYVRKTYRIYKIDLDKPRPHPEVGIRNLAFGLVSPEDANLIAQVEHVAEWLRGSLNQRVAEGNLCIAALMNDEKKIIAFNAISLDRMHMPLINLRRKLRPGCAWSEHIAVDRQYRRMHLATHLQYEALDELKRRGFHTVYGGTLPSNRASLSRARFVGFREIGDICYRKVLSFERWHCKRVRT